MKNTVLIFVILFSPPFWGRTFAQTYIPFPTDSAQWSVRYTYNNSQSCISYQYKMKGDTLLNGIIYHKIYYSLDLAYNSPNETLHCFVREDTTKKVYVKYPSGAGIDTTEFILYDFNLSVGDTITIRLLSFTTDSIYKYQLTNIFSYPTLTDTSKDYQFQTVAPTFWSCTAFGLEWIEGVGSTLGPFYNEIPQDGCSGGGYEVSCFWYKGEYVWGGFGCDYSTGIGEIQSKGNNWELYPNPANNELTIELKDLTPKTTIIQIHDLTGRLVDQVPLQTGVPNIYNVSSLSPSIYMVSLYIDGKLFKNKKLILIK